MEKNIDENTESTFESELGKKDYWDKFYSQEINQFENNNELIGEIWFGEQVQNKIINYIEKMYNLNKKVKILDMGCGNAAFLIELKELQFTNLYGMDFSENSIRLANEILVTKYNPENEENGIVLYQEDINNPDDSHDSHLNFELIHDKGTFDAFMLSKENNFESYLNYILKKSCDTNTIFILTSCNYSEVELKEFFIKENSNLQKIQSLQIIDKIPHKSFSFGGQVGQTVTTLIFKIEK